MVLDGVIFFGIFVDLPKNTQENYVIEHHWLAYAVPPLVTRSGDQIWAISHISWSPVLQWRPTNDGSTDHVCWTVRRRSVAEWLSIRGLSGGMK